MKQKSIQDFFKHVTDSPVFKKGRNVDSVPMEESLCLQLESSLEESPVFKWKNSQANSPSLDKVTSLTPDVICVMRRSNSVVQKLNKEVPILKAKEDIIADSVGALREDEEDSGPFLPDTQSLAWRLEEINSNTRGLKFSKSFCWSIP